MELLLIKACSLVCVISTFIASKAGAAPGGKQKIITNGVNDLLEKNGHSKGGLNYSGDVNFENDISSLLGPHIGPLSGTVSDTEESYDTSRQHVSPFVRDLYGLGSTSFKANIHDNPPWFLNHITSGNHLGSSQGPLQVLHSYRHPRIFNKGLHIGSHYTEQNVELPHIHQEPYIVQHDMHQEPHNIQSYIHHKPSSVQPDPQLHLHNKQNISEPNIPTDQNIVQPYTYQEPHSAQFNLHDLYHHIKSDLHKKHLYVHQEPNSVQASLQLHLLKKYNTLEPDIHTDQNFGIPYKYQEPQGIKFNIHDLYRPIKPFQVHEKYQIVQPFKPIDPNIVQPYVHQEPHIVHPEILYEPYIVQPFENADQNHFHSDSYQNDQNYQSNFDENIIKDSKPEETIGIIQSYKEASIIQPYKPMTEYQESHSVPFDLDDPYHHKKPYHLQKKYHIVQPLTHIDQNFGEPHVHQEPRIIHPHVHHKAYTVQPHTPDDSHIAQPYIYVKPYIVQSHMHQESQTKQPDINQEPFIVNPNIHTQEFQMVQPHINQGTHTVPFGLHDLYHHFKPSYLHNQYQYHTVQPFKPYIVDPDIYHIVEPHVYQGLYNNTPFDLFNQYHHIKPLHLHKKYHIGKPFKPHIVQPHILHKPYIGKPLVHQEPNIVQPDIYQESDIVEPLIHSKPYIVQPNTYQEPNSSQPDVNQEPFITNPNIHKEPHNVKPDTYQGLHSVPFNLYGLFNHIKPSHLHKNYHTNTFPHKNQNILHPYTYQEPHIVNPHIHYKPYIVQSHTHHKPHIIQSDIHQEPNTYQEVDIVQTDQHKEPHIVQPHTYQEPQIVQPDVNVEPLITKPDIHKDPHNVQPDIYQGPHSVPFNLYGLYNHIKPSYLYKNDHTNTFPHKNLNILHRYTYQEPHIVNPHIHYKPYIVQSHTHQEPHIIQSDIHQEPYTYQEADIVQTDQHQEPHIVQPHTYQEPQSVQPDVNLEPLITKPAIHKEPHNVQPDIYQRPHSVPFNLYGLYNHIKPSYLHKNDHTNTFPHKNLNILHRYTYQEPHIVNPHIHYKPYIVESHTHQEPHIIQSDIHQEPNTYQEADIVQTDQHQEPHIVQPHTYQEPHSVQPDVNQEPLITKPDIHKEPQNVQPDIYQGPYIIQPDIQQESSIAEPSTHHKLYTVQPYMYQEPDILQPDIHQKPHSVPFDIHDLYHHIKPSHLHKKYLVLPSKYIDQSPFIKHIDMIKDQHPKEISSITQPNVQIPIENYVRYLLKRGNVGIIDICKSCKYGRLHQYLLKNRNGYKRKHKNLCQKAVTGDGINVRRKAAFGDETDEVQKIHKAVYKGGINAATEVDNEKMFGTSPSSAKSHAGVTVINNAIKANKRVKIGGSTQLGSGAEVKSKARVGREPEINSKVEISDVSRISGGDITNYNGIAQQVVIDDVKDKKPTGTSGAVGVGDITYSSRAITSGGKEVNKALEFTGVPNVAKDANISRGTKIGAKGSNEGVKTYKRIATGGATVVGTEVNINRGQTNVLEKPRYSARQATEITSGLVQGRIEAGVSIEERSRIIGDAGLGKGAQTGIENPEYIGGINKMGKHDSRYDARKVGRDDHRSVYRSGKHEKY